MRVLIKGAGDLATGVAQALHRAGLEVLLTETAHPLAVRRGAALAQAVFDGQAQVEDITGRLARDVDEAREFIKQGLVPLLVDKELRCLAEFAPSVLVDATVAKKNSGFTLGMAPFMVALGPGFMAGQDVDVVVETMRGNDLGRLIYTGCAIADTGEPGIVEGQSLGRLLKANAAGVFRPVKQLGDIVRAGEIVAYCGDTPLAARISGCVRGLLQQGLAVQPGLKVGDIDPRPEPALCFGVSDKARAIGGAVLVSIMQWHNLQNS